jgi:protein tyrosine phosphatase
VVDKVALWWVFFKYISFPLPVIILPADYCCQLTGYVSNYRYKDVLPYEENRVRLTPSRENKFGYINASHITVSL